MALEFAAQGWNICGCAQSEDELRSLQDELGDTHHFARVDVSSDACVASWAENVVERIGAPDLLINNAAIINSNDVFWNIDAEEFNRLMAVNVNGTANVLRHFLPAMIQQKSGIVINFSSGWGRSVSAKVAPYCASKWAIEGLTQALADELPNGMAAVPLNPGVINTEMLQSCFGAAAEMYPVASQWARKAVPFILGLTAKHNGQPLTVPGM